MTAEGEPSEPRRLVESIHYYPRRKHWIVEVEDGPIFSLSHSQEGIFYQLLISQSIADRSVDQLLDHDQKGLSDHGAEESAGRKSPTVVLAGRLQGRANEGRPDRQDKPTAWARFLAHIDGEEGATLLSTSFHGRTREIALGLPENAPITAQGYLHHSTTIKSNARRLATFSVIHLINYPGKPSA